MSIVTTVSCADGWCRIEGLRSIQKGRNTVLRMNREPGWRDVRWKPAAFVWLNQIMMEKTQES